MTRDNISEAIGNISSKYIMEAIDGINGSLSDMYSEANRIVFNIQGDSSNKDMAHITQPHVLPPTPTK